MKSECLPLLLSKNRTGLLKLLFDSASLESIL